jgi:hypothetical protein
MVATAGCALGAAAPSATEPRQDGPLYGMQIDESSVTDEQKRGER